MLFLLRVREKDMEEGGSQRRPEKTRGRRSPEEAREDQISLLRVREEIGRKERPRGGQRGPDVLITRTRGNMEEGEAQSSDRPDSLQNP